jgi:hypothetical protein
MEQKIEHKLSLNESSTRRNNVVKENSAVQESSLNIKRKDTVSTKKGKFSKN